MDIRTGDVVSEWTLPIQTIKGYRTTEDNK